MTYAMTGPQAHMLPDGRRLHLNHGPIDLIIEADDHIAYGAAIKRFQTVLDELVSELTVLRTEIPEEGLGLRGAVAQRMESAVRPFWQAGITPMAAVAGAVAEDILAAMVEAAPCHRAYVNNGGDIALHLGAGETFTIASPTGRIVIGAADAVGGIATSGWKGRSFSLGVADSVTVLARSAAAADAAATMIANAVDLPGSPKVKRQPAREIAPDSDLRDRLVTVAVSPLTSTEVTDALARGLRTAEDLVDRDHVTAASLLLAGRVVTTRTAMPSGLIAS